MWRRSRNTILSSGLSRSQQAYRSGYIVIIVGAGISYRLADLDGRGKVYDREGFVFPEHFIELVAIADVAYLKCTPFDEFGMTI